MSARRPRASRTNPVGQRERMQEAAPPGCACPGCNEGCPDLLIWFEDDRVECQTCGTVYDPRDGKVHTCGHSDGRSADADDA